MIGVEETDKRLDDMEDQVKTKALMAIIACCLIAFAGCGQQGGSAGDTAGAANKVASVDRAQPPKYKMTHRYPGTDHDRRTR